MKSSFFGPPTCRTNESRPSVKVRQRPADTKDVVLNRGSDLGFGWFVQYKDFNTALTPRPCPVEQDKGLRRFPDGPVDLRRWVPRHRRPGMDRYERFPAHDTGRSTLDAHTTAWSALRRPLLVDVYEGEVTATQTVRVRGRSVRRYCLSI